MVGREIPIIVILSMVFAQKRRNLVAKNSIELRSRNILIASHTLLDTLNDFQGGINSDIAGDKDFFEVVEHIVVNFRLTSNSTCQLRKNTLLGLLKTLIESLLLFLVK